MSYYYKNKIGAQAYHHLNSFIEWAQNPDLVTPEELLKECNEEEKRALLLCKAGFRKQEVAKMLDLNLQEQKTMFNFFYKKLGLISHENNQYSNLRKALRRKMDEELIG